MDMERYEAFKRALWDGGARYDGAQPIPVALTPFLFAQPDYEPFAEDAQRVIEAIETISHLYCEDARIRARFPELVELEPYIRRTPRERRRINLARFDYVIAHDGRMKMVESNADCPGGMAVAGIAHRAFRGSAFHDASVEELPQPSEEAETFLELMREISGVERPRMGFIWSRVQPIMNDIQALHDLAAQKREWPAPFIGPVQELQPCEESALLADGAPMDVAFTKIDTTMRGDGAIHWCAWRDSLEEAQPVLDALASGRLRTVSGLPSMMVAESKRALALLFEEDVRSHFDAAQRAAVDRSVARTTRLEAEPALRLWHPDEVVRDKDRFVLKTLIDTRGRGVHIGREHDARDWAALVRQACEGRMVVQEYIPPRMEALEIEPDRRVEMSTVLALYLYAGRPTGIFGRASGHAVVNVGNGGVIRPALIVRTGSPDAGARP